MPNNPFHTKAATRRKGNWWRAMVGATLVAVIATGCGTAKPTGEASTTTGQGKATGSPTSTSSAKPIAADAVVATYTGGKVTKAEFETMYNTIAFLSPLMSPGSTSPTKAQFVNEYTAYFGYLLDKAQMDAKIKQSATTQVNQGYPKFIAALTSQFSTKPKLDAKLKSAGITEADLKTYMYDDSVLSAYLQKSLANVNVTAAEVNTYLQQNKLQYTQVDAAHILVKSLKTANLIEQKLKAGASFAQMAKQYSIDGSKSNGGDLGPSTLDKYVAPFANACLTLPLNTISQPVHSQFGYHIIKVLRRTVLTAQAKQDLLQQKKSTAQGALLSKVQKQANVKVVVKSDQL